MLIFWQSGREDRLTIHDKINVLLDLRLRQAVVNGAEFRRKQAEIFLVFTIVATLFVIRPSHSNGNS